jgi:hypothetical protein
MLSGKYEYISVACIIDYFAEVLGSTVSQKEEHRSDQAYFAGSY